MGLMLSKLWLLRRQTLAGGDSQESQSLFSSNCDDATADNDSDDSPINGFHLQAPADGGAPIQRLPQDLFLKIFSFLDVVSLCRCAQVSKAWHTLALHGSNWQHVDLFEFQVAIEGKVVERMSMRCGGFLRTLSLRDCQSVEDAALRTFSEHCHYIDKLVLSRCFKITDLTAESLSQNCPHLRSLDFSWCKNITDMTCTHISEGCLELQHIDLSHCSLTVEGIKALGNCSHLNSLVLEYCMEMNDEALQFIGTHCKELTRLNVSGCKQLTDVGLQAVCVNCPQLTRLGISNCEGLTDVTLRKLGASCHQLRTLEAVGCSHFTDSGFQALANVCRAANRRQPLGCSELQSMDLEECVLITDATLSCLSLNCHHLQRLVLSHCERITDAGIRHLMGGACAAESLQVLELDNCPLISDQALDLLRGCTTLRRLEIFDCQMVSRMGIRKLERSRPELRVHAFFPPHTPPSQPASQRRNICHCCTLL